VPRRKDKKQDVEILNEEGKAAPSLSDPWISMRSAIIIVAILSLAMVILVVVQGNPQMPIWERLVYGLGFGASIWVVAIVFYVLNRYILRR